MKRKMIMRLRSAKDVAVLEVLANDILDEIVEDGYTPGIAVTIQTSPGGEPVYLALVTGYLRPPAAEPRG